MCGIIGQLSSSENTVDVDRGLTKIAHRGPDERILFDLKHRNGNTETSFGRIGMVRLAIRDIQVGLYPFKYKENLLVFNGEIYNYTELKNILLSKGYSCKTTCDAEVLLPLYELYGHKAFKMIKGMFAIAIIDTNTQRITLTRDIFGEKPLFYSNKKNYFFFASELTAFPSEIRKINKNAIKNYLSIGFNPAPETFYENVYKVKPGEVVEFDEKNGLRKNQIQSISKSFISQERFDETHNQTTSKKLEHLLIKIIKEKMVSDVPVGVFLSGGIDSSLIAALAQRVSRHKLHTFSVGIDSVAIDESNKSQLVAKKIKSHHHHIQFSTKDIANYWKTLIQTHNELICDPALFPTFLLAKEAKKFCTVILTGEGADEIFSGYDRYRKELLLSEIVHKNIPVQWFKKLIHYIPSYKLFRAFSSYNMHYVPVSYTSLWQNSTKYRKKYTQLIESLWEELHLPNEIPLIAKLQLFDLSHYVSEQLCQKTDSMTMLSSIEARSPYLDTRLLGFLKESSLHHSQKNTYKGSKILLRDVAKKYLPLEIITQKKQGFSIPVKSVMQQELSLELQNTLTNPHPYLREYLDNNKNLSSYFSKPNIENDSESLTMWNILTLDHWLKYNFPNPVSNL
jgi:asparagine synthase (glutamine-hydrolysing)